MAVKYVNMADIILDTSEPANGAQAGHGLAADQPRDVVALIELLFLAYRDFVSDPDQILDEYGFGRAHHRVIHFVGRNPGMHVAELLDILRIRKNLLDRFSRHCPSRFILPDWNIRLTGFLLWGWLWPLF